MILRCLFEFSSLFGGLMVWCRSGDRKRRSSVWHWSFSARARHDWERTGTLVYVLGLGICIPAGTMKRDGRSLRGLEKEGEL